MAMGWSKADIVAHIEQTMGVKVKDDRDLTKTEATRYLKHLEAAQRGEE